MILGSKTRAVLDGRFTPSTEDVDAIAGPVLKHRIVLNFRAEAEGIKPEDIIREILDKVDPRLTLVLVYDDRALGVFLL
ncbi:MAG: hypothetical protein R3B51_05350 [Thermodesulfobacteriota bacterium]